MTLKNCKLKILKKQIKLASMLFAMTLLASCRGAPVADPVNAPIVEPTYLIQGLVDKEPKCLCPLSSGQYAGNRTNTSITQYYNIFKKNTISGESYQPESNNVTLSPGVNNPQAENFLGCSVASSVVDEPKKCDLSVAYSLTTPPSPLYMSFISAQTPTIESCINTCTSQDPEIAGRCLALNYKYYEGFAKVAGLFDKVPINGAGTISKQSLMAEYGQIPNNDKCIRSDVTYKDGKAWNSSNLDGICELSRVDISSKQFVMTSKKINQAVKNLSPNSGFTLHTYLPKSLNATIVSISARGKTIKVPVFDIQENAPLVSMSGGSLADELAAEFGGRISSAISLPANGAMKPLVVVATAKGCISSVAP